MMEKKSFNENDIDAVFRRADFGMRGSHKDELQRQLFQESESELSEDELFEAAGGLKKQEDTVDIIISGQDRK